MVDLDLHTLEVLLIISKPVWFIWPQGEITCSSSCLKWRFLSWDTTFAPLSLSVRIWIVPLVEWRSISIEQTLLWHRAIWVRISFVTSRATSWFLLMLRYVVWALVCFAICVRVWLWARNNLIWVNLGVDPLSYNMVIGILVVRVCKGLWRSSTLRHVDHRRLLGPGIRVSVWMHTWWRHIKPVAYCLGAIPTSTPLILAQLLILVVEERLLVFNVVKIDLLGVVVSITAWRWCRRLLLAKATAWNLAHYFLGRHGRMMPRVLAALSTWELMRQHVSVLKLR